MSKGHPVTVDLGAFGPRVQERVASGEFKTASEVVQAGLEALEREASATDERMRGRIHEAYADPRPSVPAEEVFERLRLRHSARLKARGGDT